MKQLCHAPLCRRRLCGWFDDDWPEDVVTAGTLSAAGERVAPACCFIRLAAIGKKEPVDLGSLTGRSTAAGGAVCHIGTKRCNGHEGGHRACASGVTPGSSKDGMGVSSLVGFRAVNRGGSLGGADQRCSVPGIRCVLHLDTAVAAAGLVAGGAVEGWNSP